MEVGTLLILEWEGRIFLGLGREDLVKAFLVIPSTLIFDSLHAISFGLAERAEAAAEFPTPVSRADTEEGERALWDAMSP